MEPLTMVLIEDSPIIIGLVTAFLEHTQVGLITLAGAARSGPEGLELVERTRPSAVVVDLRLPGMSGLDVVRQLRAKDERVAIVVLSSADRDAFETPAVEAGADAYVGKDQVTSALVPALRRAVRARATPAGPGDPRDV